MCWKTNQNREQRSNVDLTPFFITPKDYQGFPKPFSQRDHKKIGEHNMFTYGIIVASQNIGEEEGYYICYCKNTSVEYALDYSSPHK